MRNLFFRNLRLERALRRAMLQQAGGVPAEGVIRQRLLDIWNGVKVAFAKLLLVFWIFVLVGFKGPLQFLQEDLIATALSVVVAGYLILSSGKKLLLPNGGLAMASTPISSHQMLKPILVGIGLKFLFFLFCALLVSLNYTEKDSPAPLLTALAFMSLPALGLSWQIWRQGRAGGTVLRVGMAAFVAAFTLWALRSFPVLPRYFEKISSYDHWLPLNWAANWWGGTALVAIYVLAGAMGWALWRNYSFRQVPGAQVLAVYEDAETVELEESSLGSQPLPAIEIYSSPVRYSVITTLFWTAEEREVSSQLGMGSPARPGFKSLFLLGLLLLVAGIYLHSSLPQDVRGILVLSTIPVVCLMLVRGIKSEVIQSVFAKFRLPNELLQSVVSTVPVSEGRFFRMYLKESAAVLMLTLPLQLLAIRIGLEVTPFEMGASQWVMISVFLVFEYVVVKLAAWTRFLWETVSFFHPGFRGELWESLVKMLFVLPAVGLLVPALILFAGWLAADSSLSMASLFFVLHGGWIGVFCWFIRKNYRLGKGSSVFPAAKKRRSFRIW